MPDRNRTVAKILDTAASIVEQSGAKHLTIDAVAHGAGLSKGGVLYHFPSKRALLEGMLDRLIEVREERTAKAVQRAGAKGRTEAMLESIIVAEFGQRRREKAMGQALLAAAAENPGLLAPARDYLRGVLDSLDGKGDRNQLAHVILLATDGLQLLEMLDLVRLAAGERKRLRDYLLKLARETGG